MKSSTSFPKSPPERTHRAIDDLLSVMKRLRDPKNGCPWDIEQTFDTIAPYTIEEAYEVADAISRGDINDVREELGDLLLQVVFHAQMAQEKNLFDFDAVARAVTDKMIERHPHVFGDVSGVNTAGEVLTQWDDIKEAAKVKKAKQGPDASILADVPVNLPSLMRAQKLTKKAAKIGFEWEKAADILDKLEEETQELREALQNNDTQNMEEELGDLFFVLVNFARKLDIDAETALRKANDKFYRRFNGMEKIVKLTNQDLKSLTLDQMETLWQQVKKEEKSKA